jgi:hypothetical protein
MQASLNNYLNKSIAVYLQKFELADAKVANQLRYSTNSIYI